LHKATLASAAKPTRHHPPSSTDAMSTTIAESFSVEAVIRDFAAAVDRDALQLPRLTTGQRKQARRIVEEQHQGMRCESIGSGADRRLLLLKDRSVAPCPAAEAGGTSSLQASIDEFLADPVRMSMELPKLSAGERKEAKAIVERHPELRCESFGFGEERRLHLFKHESRAPPARLSCPPLPLPCEAGDRHVAGSSGVSTCSSDHGGSPGGRAAFADPPLLIRNTFLCSVGDEPADPRQVQSMPAGVFRDCLLEELMRTQKRLESSDWGLETAASEETLAAEEEPALAPGLEVEIHGLTKCPAFNGSRGVVGAFDEATGRYDILLAEAGRRVAKVRAENLQLVLPFFSGLGLASPTACGGHVAR